MNNKKLTDAQLVEVAKMHNIEPAMLKAFVVVEAAGNGFLPNDKPKILFEGHIFWQQLLIVGLTPTQHIAGNEDILYPSWDKTKYKGGSAEYDRLEKAMKIHKEAALKSASWGLFQIMGFNHKLCGYNTVLTYVEAMYKSEYNQLMAGVTYIKNRGFLQLFAKHDWKNIASRYNGPKYMHNQYDKKLEKAYNQYKYLNG